MRLINITHLDNLKFHEVADPNDVCYAILSHVWNNNEPTFRDLELVMPDSGGLLDPKFSKLMGFIQAAVAGGYQFVWADMCCIDSTNSDEVTAAAASMYSWYSSADVCYAYLRDVPSPYHEEDALPPGPPAEFSQSVWFTRAWTLQELLAPKSVVFFSTDWKVIGTKQGLSEIIEDITGIDVEVLTGKCQVQEVCITCRMSWAEKRTASKPEDRAYALMGIFGVHIPVVYGEGDHAFFRLKEEIASRTSLARGPECPLCSSPSVLSASERIGTDPGRAVHVPAHPELLRPLPDRDPGCLFVSPPDVFPQTAQLMTATPQQFMGPGSISPCHTVFRGRGPSMQHIGLFNMLQLYTPLASLSMRAPMNVEDASPKSLHLLPSGHSRANIEPLAFLCFHGPSRTTSDVISSEGHWRRVIGAHLEDTHGALSYIRIAMSPSPGSRCPKDRSIFKPWETMNSRTLDRGVYLPLSARMVYGRAGKVDIAESLQGEIRGRSNIHLSGWCKSAMEGVGFIIEQTSSSKDTLSHSITLFLPSGCHTLHARNRDQRVSIEVIEIMFPSCSLLPPHCLLRPGNLGHISDENLEFPLAGGIIPHSATSYSRMPPSATFPEGQYCTSCTAAIDDHVRTSRAWAANGAARLLFAPSGLPDVR